MVFIIFCIIPFLPEKGKRYTGMKKADEKARLKKRKNRPRRMPGMTAEPEQNKIYRRGLG